MKLQGDPVSASQSIFSELLHIVFIQILSFFLFTMMFLTGLNIFLVVPSLHLPSLMWVLLSIVLIQGLLTQIRCLRLLGLRLDTSRTRLVWLFPGNWLCVWCGGCWSGRGLARSGIFDRHSFAKCTIFLQMLHCACFAGQLILCPCVNGAPHVQHGCISCAVCCRWSLVCGRICGRLVCCVVAFTWFQLDGLEPKISLWFSRPLSRENAKFKTWAGVWTSESSYICIAVLFIFATKNSFIKSYSTFPRAAVEPSSRSLLKNVSRFSFEFCSTVISWKRSNVIFLGLVHGNPNSLMIDLACFWSEWQLHKSFNLDICFIPRVAIDHGSSIPVDSTFVFPVYAAPLITYLSFAGFFVVRSLYYFFIRWDCGVKVVRGGGF